VGFLAAIPPAVGAVMMILVAISSDRRQERKWHMIVATGLSGVFLLMAQLAGHSSALGILILLTLAVASFLGRFGPFWSLPTEVLPPAVAGVGIGLINGAGNLGGTVGPYFFGAVRDLTGSFTRERLFVGPATAGLSLWSIGAGVSQSLFDGGALRAKKRAADAAFEQAQAQYRDTVLKGFQNVADSLRAVSADASTLQAQALAEAQARETLQLTEKRFRLGAVSQLALLDAQRSWQQARINLISASASRHADSAALFLALGGGWWNRNTSTDHADQTTQASR
jgi:MFS family permease